MDYPVIDDDLTRSMGGPVPPHCEEELELSFERCRTDFSSPHDSSFCDCFLSIAAKAFLHSHSPLVMYLLKRTAVSRAMMNAYRTDFDLRFGIVAQPRPNI